MSLANRLARGGKHQRSAYRLVTHPNFDMASAVLILASTVLVGVESNHLAESGGSLPRAFGALRLCFCIIFTVELLIRIVGFRWEFISNDSDRGWNVFDMSMVFSSLFDTFFTLLERESDSRSTSRVLRILRIVRITRAMRLGRVLRYARTFRQIVYALQSSVGTLFWAMVMIFLVLYCFAIAFLQAATDRRIELAGAGEGGSRASAALRESYGSLGLALHSLYMAMTGGRSWGELMDPLTEVGGFYVFLFVIFISLVYFGVLNIVTAIFVDSAMQSQQHYKDLLIQENIFKKEVYTQHLRDVFQQIDVDGSGCINGDEMEFFLSDPSLNLYLESIDIFPNDARSLFRLLDYDSSGEVSIDEFCEGCLRLKGEAKSFDIHCMIYNNEKSQHRLDVITRQLGDLMRRLG